MDFRNYLGLYLLAAICIYGCESQTTTPMPCPGTVSIGGDKPTSPITSQSGHGSAQTVVLFDSLYTITCCGVIVSWELDVYDGSDGCLSGATCTMDFMVFDEVKPDTNTARLKGINAGFQVTKGASYTTVTIPVSDQLPVRPNDVIGYSGAKNYVKYIEDDLVNACDQNSFACNANYMTTTAGSQISNKKVGDPYTFTVVGATSTPKVNRFYTLRANIEKGAAPTFTNIPSSAIDVPYNTAVGTSVYKLFAADNNTLDMENLSIQLVRTCPGGNYFNISGTTKNTTDIKVTGSLASEPYLIHTLTLEVTDGCQVTTQTVDLRVVGPSTPNTTTANPNSNSNSSGSQGLLSTRDGRILVGLLAAALAVAIATAIGICCLCCMLKSLMGKINKTQSLYGEPYANHYSDPQYPQPRPDQYQGTPGQGQYQQTMNPYRNNSHSNYPDEPRPPSFRPDYSSGKVGSQDNSGTGNPTPRDINLRVATPRQYYKNELFW